MKIWRGGLRCKCVQSEKVELLGIQRERYRRCLFRTDDCVNLRIRIETLELRVSLGGRQTVHRCTYIAVFQSLRDLDAVLHNRSGKRDSRRYRTHSLNGT